MQLCVAVLSSPGVGAQVDLITVWVKEVEFWLE